MKARYHFRMAALFGFLYSRFEKWAGNRYWDKVQPWFVEWLEWRLYLCWWHHLEAVE